jgi:hypothetical protein
MSDNGIQMPAASPLMTMSTYNEYAMHACMQSSFNFFRMFRQVRRSASEENFIFLTLLRILAMEPTVISIDRLFIMYVLTCFITSTHLRENPRLQLFSFSRGRKLALARRARFQHRGLSCRVVSALGQARQACRVIFRAG